MLNPGRKTEYKSTKGLRRFPSSCFVLALLALGFGPAAKPGAAQSSPCGFDVLKLSPIPANSPPQQHGIFQNCGGIQNNSPCSYLSWQVSSSQSWTPIISTQLTYAFGASEQAATLFNVDVTGLPPGIYCAYFPVSEIRVGNNMTVSDSFVRTFEVDVVVSTSVMMVDPVADLVSGNAVMNSTQLQTLLTKGRSVKGVSSDGVTEVVVRISTSSPGEQFKLTLLNDQQSQSSLPNEDGALGNPGATSFSQNQLTITAGNADSNGVAYAFAVYRAPVDFARPTGTGTFKTGTCNATTRTDDQLACRSVSLQIQDITANTTLPTLPVILLRPPVILIHGVWSDWYGAWKDFYPLVSGTSNLDPRFYIGRVNYKNEITPAVVTSTNPQLSPGESMQGIRTNSLGFVYNAPGVANQAGSLLADFKNGHNPLGIPVAAIQADIISHSMGGVLARQLVLVPNFLDSSINPSNNLNQGYIHKIITVDVPHLGSPLAAKLVAGANACTRGFLETFGYYSLTSVTLSNGTTVSGAMADITGNGVAVDTSLSSALQTLAVQGPRPLPAALIAGNYTNWTSLDCTACTPARIRRKCSIDPLAQSFTSTGYPANFGTAPNNLNDGIVGVASQLNGPTSSSLLYPGMAHSPGIVGSIIGLGFTAPSVLNSATGTPPNPIAQKVVDLLNTPVTLPPFSQNVINP